MRTPLDRPLYGASWSAAVARFFGNYSIFRGRASRSEYWWWVLTNFLVTTGIAIVRTATGENVAQTPVLFFGSLPDAPVTTIGGVVALVYALATMLPNLAITWRRLHDTDRSGAWFFLIFVPLVGWIVLLAFLVGRSREGGRSFDTVPGSVPSAIR